MIELLLVVDKRRADFLATGVGGVGGHSAGLTISGENDGAGSGGLSRLLVREVVVVSLGHLERARICGGVAHERVVLAIELAGPFVVDGLSGTVDAIDHAL